MGTHTQRINSLLDEDVLWVTGVFLTGIDILTLALIGVDKSFVFRETALVAI